MHKCLFFRNPVVNLYSLKKDIKVLRDMEIDFITLVLS